MSFSLPLKNMILHEKLSAMESLWEDLAHTPETIESTAWHKDILDEHRQRVTDGSSRLIDWETAKVGICNKLS